MNDIATNANVAVGSIHRYFHNKEDLLIAIFEEKMGELILELENRLQKIEDPKKNFCIYSPTFLSNEKPNHNSLKYFKLSYVNHIASFREYRPQKTLGISANITRYYHSRTTRGVL